MAILSKELIKEAFRLQTLAGIKPINECSCGAIGECGCNKEEPVVKFNVGGVPMHEPDEVDFTHGEDHEGSMAHSEVKSLISNASKLEQLLKGNPELPGWVSAYITLASDYMNSVADYLVDQADTNEYEN
jgi:hypothetical protein